MLVGKISVSLNRKHTFWTLSPSWDMAKYKYQCNIMFYSKGISSTIKLIWWIVEWLIPKPNCESGNIVVTSTIFKFYIFDMIMIKQMYKGW